MKLLNYCHKYLLFTLLFLGLSFQVKAQELNCAVKVLAPQLLSTTNQSVIQTLETAIKEFMNNRKWTGDIFESHERIECNISITIDREITPGNFAATANIQSSRPVYNSDYKTVIMNHVDQDFTFQYAEFQPLEYNETSFTTDLTSMLAFYAYMIIAMDYDTYGLKGGTQYFAKAQQVMEIAKTVSTSSGWKPFQKRLLNRYGLIEKFTDVKYQAMREVYYDYHIKGLDRMYENPQQTMVVFNACLARLEVMNKNNPNFIVLQIFFNAKSDELVDIYSGSQGREKIEAVNILQRLDGKNSKKYDEILKKKK